MRGPQSAQYGRGTYAGAINYVTRNGPVMTLAGEVFVNAANHDTGAIWPAGSVVRCVESVGSVSISPAGIVSTAASTRTRSTGTRSAEKRPTS